MNPLRRNEVQNEAFNAWLSKGKFGTVEIVTGLGKTFIWLKALHSMPKNDGKIHLFLAEVVDRMADVKKSIETFDKIFKKDTLKDYEVVFGTYQGACKKVYDNLGLVGADEIHDSMTPEYSKFFLHNAYDALIGLTATVNKEVSYTEQNKTKGDYLDEYAPVVFTYGIVQARKEKTTRELVIEIIDHQLDSTNKTIKAGSPKKPFYTTEKAQYDYYNKRIAKLKIESSQFNVNAFIKNNQASFDMAMNSEKTLKALYNARAKFLWGLPSKVKIATDLLSKNIGKTIVFGNDLTMLTKVTPYVLSSRKSAKTNEDMRKKFDSGEIQVIGSFKKLKQGATLGDDLDCCIIMSYYSLPGDFIQRIGRLRDNGTIGKVYIIRTLDTQEESWVETMMESFK